MADIKDVAFAGSVRELGQGETQPCVDPECAAEGGVMESEQDGDHRYMECDTCGYSASYSKVPTAILSEDSEGNCAIGVPTEVRAAASGQVTKAMDKIERDNPKPLDLGLSIGKRPGL